MGIRDPKWGVWLPECSLLLRLWTCCWSSRTWAVSSSFMSLSFYKVKMKKVLQNDKLQSPLINIYKFLSNSSPDISSNITDIFSIRCGKWIDQHTWFSEVVFVSLSKWALCWSGVIRSEASYSSHCGGTNKDNHNNITESQKLWIYKSTFIACPWYFAISIFIWAYIFRMSFLN